MQAWRERPLGSMKYVYLDARYEKVRRRDMKASVASDIRSVFNAPDRHEADVLLKRTVVKYAQDAPRLSAWMEENLPEGLTVFAFPEAHRRLIRTTNGLERLNREIRRRSRVASLFPNDSSCLRLVTAVVMEISEDWQTGKRYIRWESVKE